MRIAAERWELEVRPERGGRITSLRLDGEELLDQGIGVDQPTANGFVEGGAFGWDEMVPNLEATDALPDHGEAWRAAWKVVRSARIELSMHCRGKLVPWDLTRALYLRHGAVMAVYTYRNTGKQPHPAYWCAHPLFRYETDMEISVDVPRPANGQSDKVFFPSGSIDRVGLRWRSGTAVAVRWDPTLTPDVAIWVCNGDLGGYRQIAVEPATAAPMLPAGKALRWWLAIEPL
ncbi:MAG TPA: hypothetical protein VJT78_00980 [Candidatus Dormibacteraeota bacterium]|nr:hypothetical protein [Candidatus Dormibacteraeota bacterium]